jgi:hypothetical protein
VGIGEGTDRPGRSEHVADHIRVRLMPFSFLASVETSVYCQAAHERVN